MYMMKHLNFVKANVWTASLTLAGVGIMATGCVERRVEYVPVYRVQPAYVSQPGYPPPVVYQAQPAPAQSPPNTGAAGAPTADWQPAQAAPAPAPAQAAPPPQAVVVAPSAPPPIQVEVIPVAPGPYYAWVPGYWSWNGGWLWIGGHYLARPRPNVVWAGGHWGRHGHGYVWLGGGWR